MNVIKTDIEDVLIIEPKVFGDERGYFFESFSSKRFEEEVWMAMLLQVSMKIITKNVFRIQI